VIGLDTNVLLRFLLQDEPIQSPIATRIVEQELSEATPGFVSAVVLAEVAWVLESRYRLPQSDIAAVMEGLLRLDGLRLEHPLAVAAAVTATTEKNVDFADSLISLIAKDAGCATTLTFDRRAQRLPGFSAA
jgi:predicted nucleic-acid-binding protein